MALVLCTENYVIFRYIGKDEVREAQQTPSLHGASYVRRQTDVRGTIDGAVATAARAGAMQDSDIRSALVQMLQGRSDLAGGLIVTELAIAMGCSKLDVAVLNGHLAGYEIKSDRDSLTRVVRQVSHYQEVCDELTIVTTERYREAIDQSVPEWCGIVVASVCDGLLVLQTYRAAKPNPHWDVLALMLLLWQSETIEMARGFGFRAPRTMAKGLIHAQLARRISHDTLRDAVLTRLRCRATSGRNFAREALSLPNTDQMTFRRTVLPLSATR